MTAPWSNGPLEGQHQPAEGAADVPFPRQDILQIITALIENAAPSSDHRTRSRRYSRGLVLWAALLGIISESAGITLEESSPRCPVSLRRRFVSALHYRRGKRWPCSPYGAKSGRRIERREIAAIYGFRPPLQVPVQTVAAGPGRL